MIFVVILVTVTGGVTLVVVVVTFLFRGVTFMFVVVGVDFCSGRGSIGRDTSTMAVSRSSCSCNVTSGKDRLLRCCTPSQVTVKTEIVGMRLFSFR